MFFLHSKWIHKEYEYKFDPYKQKYKSGGYKLHYYIHNIFGTYNILFIIVLLSFVIFFFLPVIYRILPVCFGLYCFGLIICVFYKAFITSELFTMLRLKMNKFTQKELDLFDNEIMQYYNNKLEVKKTGGYIEMLATKNFFLIEFKEDSADYTKSIVTNCQIYKISNLFEIVTELCKDDEGDEVGTVYFYDINNKKISTIHKLDKLMLSSIIMYFQTERKDIKITEYNSLKY